MPGASGNYKPPAAFEESNCRNIKGIMTCICCWVLASQLASKACNVPLTGIHWRRRGRNMEYDLHRFTPQVRKYSPAKFQGTKLRQTAPKGIASRQRYCSFVVCLCMLDIYNPCIVYLPAHFSFDTCCVFAQVSLRARRTTAQVRSQRVHTESAQCTSLH